MCIGYQLDSKRKSGLMQTKYAYACSNWKKSTSRRFNKTKKCKRKNLSVVLENICLLVVIAIKSVFFELKSYLKEEKKQVQFSMFMENW